MFSCFLPLNLKPKEHGFNLNPSNQRTLDAKIIMAYKFELVFSVFDIYIWGFRVYPTGSNTIRLGTVLDYHSHETVDQMVASHPNVQYK
jgi:hypothetical protein